MSQEFDEGRHKFEAIYGKMELYYLIIYLKKDSYRLKNLKKVVGV